MTASGTSNRVLAIIVLAAVPRYNITVSSLQVGLGLNFLFLLFFLFPFPRHAAAANI